MDLDRDIKEKRKGRKCTDLKRKMTKQHRYHVNSCMIHGFLKCIFPILK